MNKPSSQAILPRVAAWLLAASMIAVPAQAASTTASHAATTSFHFQDIPVRSALQLIAEEGHFNLVVSDSVKGNLTLRLDDVTWEQALDIVLKLKGLGKRVDGNATVSVSGG